MCGSFFFSKVGGYQKMLHHSCVTVIFANFPGTPFNRIFLGGCFYKCSEVLMLRTTTTCFSCSNFSKTATGGVFFKFNLEYA